MTLIKFFLKKLIFISLFVISSNGYGQTGKLSGQVTDAGNQETLSGVTISVIGTKIKTIADMDGNFSLSLAPGKYKILISFISYETTTLESIEIKSNMVQDIKVKLNQASSINSAAAESLMLKQLVSQHVASDI